MNLSIDNVIVQLRIINYEILSSKLEIVSSKQYYYVDVTAPVPLSGKARSSLSKPRGYVTAGYEAVLSKKLLAFN